MDFNRLHTELRRLSELVDGWRDSEQIIEIERDLALAKLRELYEALRFAHTEPVAPDSDGASAPAESIDLDAVLGLASEAGAVESFAGASGPETPEPGVAEDFVPAPEAESAAASEVASAAESVSASVEMPRPAPSYDAAAATNVAAGSASGPDSAPEIEPAVAFEPIADSEPVAMSESENSSGTAAVSGSVPRQNPLPEPETTGSAIPPFEPAAVSEAPAVASGSFGSAGSTSAPESSEPSEAAESFGHPLPQADAPAAASAASGESLPVEPQAPESVPDHGAKPQAEPLSLFDVEKLSVRRAKHRVVLSLYDDDEPAPKSEPRAVSHLSERPAPHAGAVHPEPQDSVPYPEPDRTGPVEHASGIPAAAPVRESEAGEPHMADSRSVSDRAAAKPLSAEREEVVHHGSQPEAASPIPPQSDESHPHAAGRRPGETVVLGELLGGEVKTLGDVIASRLDPAPAVGQEPVGDLRRAICANDRFLLVRDLFAGDAEAYDAAIDRLNTFDDLDECVIYIAEHYDWNPNSEGARLLMELIERKLS